MAAETKTIKSVDNRIVLIQYICAVIVVFIHANTTESWALSGIQQGLSVKVQAFLSDVWLVAVPTFFFISGYFMFVKYNPKNYFNFIKKRFFSLAVPFFVWNLIFYVMYYVVTQIPSLSKTMNREALPLSVTYFFKTTFLSGGFAPLWYLKELFFFSVISIALYYLLKNKYVAIVVVLAFITLNCVLTDNIEPLHWLPFFLTGAYAGMHIKKYEFSGNKKALKITAAATVIVTLFILSSVSPYSFVRYLYRITGGILFPIILATLLKKEIRLPWIFTISLFIYCTHGFILQAVQKIYLVVLGVSNFTSLLCYFTAPLVCIAIITIIALFMHKFTPHIWRFLNGGRKV